jgi:hypothetical protein
VERNFNVPKISRDTVHYNKEAKLERRDISGEMRPPTRK